MRAKSFLPRFSTAVTSPCTAAISFFTPSMIWSIVSSRPRLSRMKVAWYLRLVWVMLVGSAVELVHGLIRSLLDEQVKAIDIIGKLLVKNSLFVGNEFSEHE